ncbi:YlxR family protein [Corynebacterium sp. sy017]|nr:YlxR family protein [Corynebacterium sp. sy017]QDZ43564.1 YlxR family protein [Corynebacterium sp. sy039]TSD92741.1 YlxR family protein [Corynebacterium sp. SY003]
MSSRKEPIRTCIATSRKYPQSQLLRVTVDKENSGHVVPDPRRRLGGRGAWITPTISAYELAIKRRAFARALRVSTAVDTGHVHTYLLANTALKTHIDDKEDRTLMSTR